MEIESWYIAGVNDKKRKEFKYGSIPEHTDNLCKEKVYSIIKNKKNRDILTELIRIVNNYDISVAKMRNNSLMRFIASIEHYYLRNRIRCEFAAIQLRISQIEQLYFS